MDFYAAVRERMEARHGPLGERLRNALTAVLDSGAIAPGESLPSEREMAEALAQGAMPGLHPFACRRVKVQASSDQ